MANEPKIYSQSESLENSNATSHYVLIAIGVVIGFIGIILRFLGDGGMIDLAANIIFVIGIVISLIAVFRILR